MPDAVAVASAPVAATPAAPAAPAAVSPAAVKVDSKVPAVAAKAEAKVPAAKTEATKAEVKAAEVKQLVKLVVDGKEEEVELEEAVRRAQTNTAADKRFKEASQLRKEAADKEARVNGVLDMMLKDPAGFAKQAKGLGLDPQKFAESILEPILREQIAAEEEKLMSEDQRKVKDMERQLQEYARKDAEAKKAAEDAGKQKEAAAHQAVVDGHKDRFGNALKDALEQSKLPQTYETTLELVALMEETIEKGLPIEPRVLARDLVTRKKAELNAILKASGNADFLDPEFRKLVMQGAASDPEIRELVRKASVEDFKKNNPMVTATPITGTPSEKDSSSSNRKKQSYGAMVRDLQRGAVKRGG